VSGGYALQSISRPAIEMEYSIDGHDLTAQRAALVEFGVPGKRISSIMALRARTGNGRTDQAVDRLVAASIQGAAKSSSSV